VLVSRRGPQQDLREAIDVILEIWRRDPPYASTCLQQPLQGVDGQERQSAGRHRLPFDLFKPHPEIRRHVLAPFSQASSPWASAISIALGNFLVSKWIAAAWDNYRRAGQCRRDAEAGRWRIARAVFVADDDKVAERYGRMTRRALTLLLTASSSTKLTRSGRLSVFKEDKDQPDATITHDYLMDRLVLQGGVSKVVDQILALREIAGPFGELVYAGDWSTGPPGRSMRLMAEVIPRQRGDRKGRSGGECLLPKFVIHPRRRAGPDIRLSRLSGPKMPVTSKPKIRPGGRHDRSHHGRYLHADRGAADGGRVRLGKRA
jgi:alkanesulfonate monooxygenase SsuD/methylene tetrahydromethanopterin reductase-like flavin-dependent oxidoreductase (luciferase family)